MRRAAAVLLALLVVTAPVADAQPTKCAKQARAKSGSAKASSKGCRKFAGVAAQPVRAGVPMVGVDPFTTAAPPAPAPTPTTDVPTTDPAPPPPPPPPAPARLGVVAREWSLTLSRTTLAAGPALVELQNFGEDAHNLRIERVDGTGGALDLPLAEAGERQKAAGTLPAGTYKVYCTLPGHDAQGMHARLTVN